MTTTLDCAYGTFAYAFLKSLPITGDSKESAAATRKNKQMGRVKKILKLPSLIIKEPTKFCSAILPRIIPMMIADMEKPSLFRKYPTKPEATIKYTSFMELL